MMIKILRYEARSKDVVGGAVKQRLSFDTALSTGRYIFDLELSPSERAALEQIKPIGDYVTAEQKRQDGAANANADKGKRIGGRYAYNLVADEPEGQVEELSLLAARAGLKHYWHIIVSHRPGEVISQDDGEIIRQTISRVLGVEECPAIWATHCDEPHQHDHGLVVSFLADEDQAVSFGAGWWKEKAQIAIAICEFELGLMPEPNRNYTADATGVYTMHSDLRVADAAGNLVIDRDAMRAMQRERDEQARANDAPEGIEAGDEWSLGRMAKQFAAVRIQQSKSWLEVNTRLARIGLRYVTVGNTGRLETMDPGQGQGQRPEWVGAGMAYANAALGKLSNRIGEYEPPDSAIARRPFVMPRYNKRSAENRSVSHARFREREECDALIEHLKTENAARYRRLRDRDKGDMVNAARKNRAAKHRAELDAAKLVKRRCVRKSTALAKGEPPTPAPLDTGFAMLWGPPPRKIREMSQRDAARIKSRYSREEKPGALHYLLDGKLAMIRRLQTIEVIAPDRLTRIDALLLAKEQFAKVRVAAREAARTYFAALAAELRMPLAGDDLNRISEAHKADLSNGKRTSILERGARWHRERTCLVQLRRDIRARTYGTWAGGHFNPAVVANLERRTEDQRMVDTWGARPDPAPGKARRHLDLLDRNRLQLAGSRASPWPRPDLAQYRFLDDPALLAHFAKTPGALLQPELQKRLHAIEAIQIEERRWLAAALLQNRVAIERGELVTRRKEDAWASEFWHAQKSDPSFLRLIAVARLRPDRFGQDLDRRPEIAAWQHHGEQDSGLAGLIADETFLASRRYGQRAAETDKKRKNQLVVLADDVDHFAEQWRESLFRTMEFNEARKLRKSGTKFYNTYITEVRRKPGENDRQWQQRIDIVQGKRRPRVSRGARTEV